MAALPVRIGLSTYRERAAWSVWDEPADLLPASYADEVAAVGAVPMLLPPAGAAVAEAAESALDGVHGLVITGGPDVEPERYGAERDPRTGPARPQRDEWEFQLTRAALTRDLPVLAICRGMQVLNVALGGTLVQHLPAALGSDAHCPTIGRHAHHEVRTAPGSRAHALLGSDVVVATYHHQGVGVLPDDLVATAWAADGLIEAVEFAGASWVLGVQWHPEVKDGTALFAALRDAAQEYRVRTTGVGA